MKNDIRKATCLIIRKNSEYLVGTVMYSSDLRWSTSPYDAWKTRDIEEARRIALKTGGIMMLWNPVARQMKVM